jgi:hypothetical protein
MQRFNPGQIVATQGALALNLPPSQLSGYIHRHLSGDWGVISADDKALNDEALANPDEAGRFMSAYPIDEGQPCRGFGANTIWVITDVAGPDTATTILLPDEY